MTDKPIRIAILASPTSRTGDRSDLVRLISATQQLLTDVLQARLLVTGGVADALGTHGLLLGYPGLEVLPVVEEGAMATIAARIVTDDPDRAVDWVIYLTDPSDVISLHPESLAIKRQCVVHGKPYLATLQAAAEWCLLEAWSRNRQAVSPHLARFGGQPEDRLLALVAHDTRKAEMLRFANRHFGLLDRFRDRVSTGTTGQLLNGEIPARLAAQWQTEQEEADLRLALKLPAGALAARLTEQQEIRTGAQAMASRLAGRGVVWTHPFRSGPKGGDAEIADLILSRPGATVVFFEDPHVAREHEADIQLLERAARRHGDTNQCFHHPDTADRWATLMEALLAAGERPVLRALLG